METLKLSKKLTITKAATLVIAISFIFLFALLNPLLSDETSYNIFKPNDVEIVAMGTEIYAANCASCHGDNLEGQTPNWRSPSSDGKLPAPPHDQSGHTWHHTDRLLFDLTKFGIKKAAGLKNYESNMPIYGDILSDDEIIAVLSFIKSTWPREIRDRHDQMNALKASE